ncbi:MAG: metallopeptidase TldD-related protein [Micromonosporaceae bacterium]
MSAPAMSVADRLVEQVLDLVRRQAPTAEAEVNAKTETVALTRFANSFIHQNVSDTTVTVQLRLHVDGRTASGATTVAGGPADSDGLASLVARTLRAISLLPVDEAWPGLTPPGGLAGSAPTRGWDPAVADASPATRAAVVRAFTEATEGLVAAGYCRTVGTIASFGNTAGQTCAGATSHVAVDGMARAAGADGVARIQSARLSDVDGAALGAVAAAKARAGADPVDLEPGRYPVLLEPNAVSDLLQTLGMWGYNGKAVAERRSFVDVGAPQLDPAINLADNPLGADSPQLPFDPEGVERRRVELVKDGVSVAVAHDRRTAADADGAQSTGHAQPPGWRTGPTPDSLLLAPADAPTAPAAGRPVADEATAGLLQGMQRGLLVSDLWYTRVLDPRTLVVTGLTRNGVWLVERGEIVGPVTNFRFTQSYPGALGPGNVAAVGARASVIPAHWGEYHVSAPPLRLTSWNFTGGAAG